MSAVRALARVNVAAIARNCARLRRELGAGVRLCVVVKADGYGHGALPSARAAIAGGADMLAVATAQEAAALRRGGVSHDVIVLGVLTPAEIAVAIAADAEVTAWTPEFVSAVAALGRGRVHVKLDTGMGRLGTRDPHRADEIAAAIVQAPGLTLAGAMTHFATADEPWRASSWSRSTRAFSPGRWRSRTATRRSPCMPPTAPPPCAIRARTSTSCVAAWRRTDWTRSARIPQARGLEPALTLHSTVGRAVKACRAGESAGYGRTVRGGGK